MFIRESQWLAEQLAAVPSEQLFPLLDIGSQSHAFRTKQQPHIEANVFAPLRRRGGAVHHLDIRPLEGVDIVGDLRNRDFVSDVRKLRIRSVLVSNLLEHVADPQEIADAILQIVPQQGYLFISGPYSFPYHPEPIDTMYRPTPEEVHHLFLGTSMVSRVILDAGNWRNWDKAERGRSLPHTLLRLCLPFYKPQVWWSLARQSAFLWKRAQAYAVVLRKKVGDAGSGLA